MSTEDIKLFGMSHQMLERDLDTVEQTLHVDLGRERIAEASKDERYYPQFNEAIRRDASYMAQHYEIFYCLEQSIRTLIRDRLKADLGAQWWDKSAPEPVKKNVAFNITRERDSGVTMRSAEEIDYTTFGELGEIVKSNWQTFSDTFNSHKAFEKIMTNLNILRGPIAHCCPLAEDEVVRLQLSLKDWFRLME
jgi:hypothetical protein